MVRKLALGAFALLLSAAPALGQPVPNNFNAPPQPVVSAPWLLQYAAVATASVATTSGSLAAVGAYTTFLAICTLPAIAFNVWLNPAGAAAVVGKGIRVPASGGCVTFGAGGAYPLPAQTIFAITDNSSAQTVTLTGY